jgi:hypothetical protein
MAVHERTNPPFTWILGTQKKNEHYLRETKKKLSRSFFGRPDHGTMHLGHRIQAH